MQAYRVRAAPGLPCTCRSAPAWQRHDPTSAVPAEAARELSRASALGAGRISSSKSGWWSAKHAHGVQNNRQGGKVTHWRPAAQGAGRRCHSGRCHGGPAPPPLGAANPQEGVLRGRAPSQEHQLPQAQHARRQPCCAHVQAPVPCQPQWQEQERRHEWRPPLPPRCWVLDRCPGCAPAPRVLQRKSSLHAAMAAQ